MSNMIIAIQFVNQNEPSIATVYSNASSHSQAVAEIESWAKGENMFRSPERHLAQSTSIEWGRVYRGQCIPLRPGR